MSNVYLDSSVLIASQIENHPFHSKAKDFLTKLHDQNCVFCISPLAIDECIYVFFKYQRTGYLDATVDIRIALKRITYLSPIYINIVWEETVLFSIYKLIRKYSLKSRDAFHLQTMQDNVIEYIATFDTDFTKLFEHNTVKSAEELLR